jgi:hypothetical protein
MGPSRRRFSDSSCESSKFNEDEYHMSSRGMFEVSNSDSSGSGSGTGASILPRKIYNNYDNANAIGIELDTDSSGEEVITSALAIADDAIVSQSINNYDNSEIGTVDRSGFELHSDSSDEEHAAALNDHTQRANEKSQSINQAMDIINRELGAETEATKVRNMFRGRNQKKIEKPFNSLSNTKPLISFQLPKNKEDLSEAADLFAKLKLVDDSLTGKEINIYANEDLSPSSGDDVKVNTGVNVPAIPDLSSIQSPPLGQFNFQVSDDSEIESENDPEHEVSVRIPTQFQLNSRTEVVPNTMKVALAATSNTTTTVVIPNDVFSAEISDDSSDDGLQQ